MNAKTAFVMLAASGIAAFAMGCGGAVAPVPDDDAIGRDEASLRRMKSCGELLTELRSDSKFKLNKGIDLQIAAIRRFGANGGYYGGVGMGGFGGDARAEGSSSPTAPPAPNAGSGSGTGSTPATPQATDHSGTTTQVAGVDEADFVKADNQNLYLLHGADLKVLRAWPKESMAELGSAKVEGTPTEMFLSGQTLVVYSQVNGAKLFQAAGVPMRETYNDWGGSYGGGVDVAGGAPEPSTAPPRPGGGGAREPYYPLTKITVFNVVNNVPQVARELFFEGHYEDSRRVGSHVRTVLNGGAHGPKLKYGVELAPGESYPTDANGMIAKLEALRAANIAILDASTVADWLPVAFERNGTSVTAASPRCEDYYVPTTGSTTFGLTQVESLDLAAPTAPIKSAAVTGMTKVVYGNGGSLVLAQQAYVDLPWLDIYASWQAQSGSSGSGGGGVSTPPSVGSAEPAPAPDTPVPPRPSVPGQVGLKESPAAPTAAPLPTRFATDRTHLHKFSFASDPTFPLYVGSGSVTGSVDDQYSLDEYQGNLRVATTDHFLYLRRATNEAERLAQPETENHVRVLGAPTSGGRLPRLGDTGKLAPGERIYSVRFMESKGYVVTFRQVDPLFSLDLSVPTNPRVTGELKIPGFSEFMVPMDQNHLLTIGRDATPQGRVQGLALQIFDVTNPARPTQSHKFSYSASEYGHSEALYDPKAFTYFKERGLLAFPYMSSGGSGGMRSSLEIFRVSVGSGFSKAGSLDHTSLVSSNPGGYGCGYYGPSVRRGVFLEDVAYSISYGGIIASKVDQLASPPQVLRLGAPVVPGGGYCGGAETGGGAVPPSPGGVPVPDPN